MELIDRYIYAVTKRLPEKQREDIEKELRGLIDDMLAERGPNPTEQDVEAVLRELGDPARFADQYRGKNRYLISPEYFDKYLTVLKIALAGVALGMTVATVVQYAVTPPDNIAGVFGDIVGSIFMALVQAFAWVTLIFALIDYHSADHVHEKSVKREFDPKNLPEVPVREARIKRSGPIVSMIFCVFFVIILNFSPQLFSIYLNGIPLTPVFDLDVLRGYLLFIDISFAAIFIREVLKLIYGRYCIPFAVGNTILSGVSIIVTISFFSNPNIWNKSFISEISGSGNIRLPAGFDAVNPMITVSRIFVAVCIFAFLLETITTIVKTVRYESPHIKQS